MARSAWLLLPRRASLLALWSGRLLQCLARSLDTVAITDIDIAAGAYARASCSRRRNAVAAGGRRRPTLNALFDLVVRSFPGFIDDAIACSMDAARRDASGDVQRRISTARRALHTTTYERRRRLGRLAFVGYSGRPVRGDGEFWAPVFIEGRTTAIGEAAVTVNGVDTLSKLDLRGRGSEIDAALGLDGPRPLWSRWTGKLRPCISGIYPLMHR